MSQRGVAYGNRLICSFPQRPWYSRLSNHIRDHPAHDQRTTFAHRTSTRSSRRASSPTTRGPSAAPSERPVPGRGPSSVHISCPSRIQGSGSFHNGCTKTLVSPPRFSVKPQLIYNPSPEQRRWQQHEPILVTRSDGRWEVRCPQCEASRHWRRQSGSGSRSWIGSRPSGSCVTTRRHPRSASRSPESASSTLRHSRTSRNRIAVPEPGQATSPSSKNEGSALLTTPARTKRK